MIDQETDAKLIQAYLNGNNWALERLVKKYQRPLFSFILRYVGNSELSFKEIAAMLNCSINTVLGRMHYAVNNLRKTLQKEFGDELTDVL